jgi:hypothetical protein
LRSLARRAGSLQYVAVVVEVYRRRALDLSRRWIPPNEDRVQLEARLDALSLISATATAKEEECLETS